MSSVTHINLDDQGFPVLLAEPAPALELAPKAVVPSTRPATIDHVEWARRQDAVRDAAREFEELTEQDLKERLRGVTSKPLEDGDLAQFRADVRAAVLDDLVDVFDHRTRGKLRGRRTVRVVVPNGYFKKALRSLNVAEANQLEGRLSARGWTDRQVKDDLWGKIPHLTRGALMPSPTAS